MDAHDKRKGVWPGIGIRQYNVQSGQFAPDILQTLHASQKNVDNPAPLIPTQIAQCCTRMRDVGFCFVPADRAMLEIEPADWARFAASWNDMPEDTYMADGGHYRRRRHATLSLAPSDSNATNATEPTLEAHQPHYQSRDYNNLNGGIARHFAPIDEAVVQGTVLKKIFALCADVFGALSPGRYWHIETHQFRIEASAGAEGQPTPEGVHRDGVDYVMVMMVTRHNIREGTTTIHHPDGTELASFTLIEPRDMTLVDDHRCLHGVTPVMPIDAAQPAWRDVLVVTFREKIPGQ